MIVMLSHSVQCLQPLVLASRTSLRLETKLAEALNSAHTQTRVCQHGTGCAARPCRRGHSVVSTYKRLDIGVASPVQHRRPAGALAV